MSRPSLDHDGIFKHLTWDSTVLTSMFGFPAITDTPLQQEIHEPARVITDRLYRLADGSLLHIEHQSSLRDKADMTERMALYHVRLRRRHLGKLIRQVVIYTGLQPADRTRLPGSLSITSTGYEGHGLLFSVPLKDLLGVPPAVFRQSGKLDDLLLGLMGSGRFDRSYVSEVAARVAAVRNAGSADARLKFVAVCGTVGIDVEPYVKEFSMWIEDVKDSKIIKDIVRIAGRAAMDRRAREVLARNVVRCAMKQGSDVSGASIDELIVYANEEQLEEMLHRLVDADMPFEQILDDLGIVLPSYRR